MNRNDFLNMIEDTVPVNRQIIGEVYELIDIFPYFQSAHMLLLKGLRNNADVKFENQLRNSAIHVADREVLYYLLKTKTLEETGQTIIHKEIVPSDNVVSDTLQTVIESAKNSDYLIDEIEKNSGEIKTVDQNDTVYLGQSHSILISTEADNIESAGVMLLTDEEIPADEDQIFYMDPGFSVPDQSDLLELDLDEDKTILLEGDDINPEQVDSDGNSKKHLQSELIEKFIIANPRIEPGREKTNLAGDDISKPYIEETGGFVTETLARIYTNQGYYSKAIEIYEKLSLKFPEKSSYFASQIEKVKEYIKN
ncbi:MAG: tetratricopeptide repeat-containing protein [Bacteroidetes bacterium]|nr:MAG: tetratricopeptide repeat-containing protein [Bacteroidota bacterium]